MGERDLAVLQHRMSLYEELLKTDNNNNDDENRTAGDGQLIDDFVHTTSAKQATAQILKIFGIQMEWVWDELAKKRSTS